MTVHHRRRRAASLIAVAALGLSGQAVAGGLGSPATAAPAEDCASSVPVSEVTDGESVTGLTVTRGTTPVGFTGEVLGVLEDGIAPDVDMIMAELEMPEFARTGGIWQGMSGSPVYAADGRLIGAVAYGLSFGASPIAGITPYAEMDDLLAAEAPAERIALRGDDAREVADRADITPAQASRGFTPLPLPLSVSGVAAGRLARVQADGPEFLQRAAAGGGTASAAAADADTIVAGGNLAASAAYGDVSFAGVGTATSVCEGRVVGFGHPMAFLGTTTMGLHPASALFVQPESVGAPFKVANVAPPVGTITDDRTTGIAGAFGPVPRATDVTSTVTYDGSSRTGGTDVFVEDFLPDIALYQTLVNQDRVVDGPARGSELLTWTVTGSEGDEPFELSYTDRWSGRDLAFETAISLAETAYSLRDIEGVSIDSFTTDADVDDDQRTHTLDAVQQRRDGRWRTVTRKAPAVARAGGNVALRLVLDGTAGRRVIPLAPVAVPKRARGPLVLSVQGGDGGWSMLSGSTVDEVRTSLDSQLRHDQLRVQLGTPDKVDRAYGGDDFFFLGFERGARLSFVRTRTTEPQSHVVSGTRNLRVRLR
ncbi:hypothetical protein GCM10009737_06860 [Nocardioides lentus]|uniref:Peptidase S55 domain-containing protein n=1 Tax=Nocardioides lentus TaxID=338077 RepID=A0ABP5AC71_9ACTN